MPPRTLDDLPSLTPLQLAIFETDQLGLTLRDSTRLVTARMGYFVGQHRYLQERARIETLVAQFGPPGARGGWDPVQAPRPAAPQTGSP